MKKRILFVTVLALFAILTLAVPASANKPADVNGTFEYAGPPSDVVMRPAGNNCIIDAEVVYAFFGDLEGIATLQFRIVSHGTCPAQPFQYNENLKAEGTFVGSVNGKEGSFDLNYVAKGWPADPGELALTGKINVLSGTGELANLHGVLDISYLMGDDFDTYSGQIHFDP